MLTKLIMLIANLNMVNTESIYNYYELAVQKWCSDDYMIHGLWPQINSTDYPVNCKPVLYIEPEGTLLINMNTYWSSCDNTLWEHEWEKHGSCMQVQNNINETSFFNKTISLFIENKKLLENCKDDDCIMGCFDLDYNLINC